VKKSPLSPEIGSIKREKISEKTDRKLEPKSQKEKPPQNQPKHPNKPLLKSL